MAYRFRKNKNILFACMIGSTCKITSATPVVGFGFYSYVNSKVLFLNKHDGGEKD